MSIVLEPPRTESLQYDGWRVVAACAVGVFFATLPVFTFAVLLKPIAAEFSWSREAVSGGYATFTLCAALSAPFIGHLFDRIRSRWICGACLAIIGCGLASLSFLTPRVWHLIAAFAVMGAALPATSAVVYARVVSSWFDTRRGAALAAVIAAAALGAMVHPPLAEALVQRVGWRSAVLWLGGASLVIAVPTVVRFVRERTDSAHQNSGATGATVAEAVRSRVFWILIVVVFGTTLGMNGVIVHLAALLTDRGVSSSHAAIVMSVFGAASLTGRLLTGWLLDRHDGPRVTLVLLLIASAGTFMLADAHSFAIGALAAGLIGLGTGGEADVIPYLLSRYFGLRSLSTLFGLHYTAWGLAGAAGPLMMGRAFDTTGSYGPVLVILAAGTLAVALLTLALPRPRPPVSL